MLYVGHVELERDTCIFIKYRRELLHCRVWISKCTHITVCVHMECECDRSELVANQNRFTGIRIGAYLMRMVSLSVLRVKITRVHRKLLATKREFIYVVHTAQPVNGCVCVRASICLTINTHAYSDAHTRASTRVP